MIWQLRQPSSPTSSKWRLDIELRSVLTRLTLHAPAGLIDAAALHVADAPPKELRALQRTRIAAVHRENGGNVSATARHLGVSRNTVHRALG